MQVEFYMGLLVVETRESLTIVGQHSICICFGSNGKPTILISNNKVMQVKVWSQVLFEDVHGWCMLVIENTLL